MRLVVPGDFTGELIHPVVLAYPVIELIRQPADDLFIPEIRIAKPARYKSAHMPGGFQERCPQTLARRRDGRDHAARRAAVNHHIKGSGGCTPRDRQG